MPDPITPMDGALSELTPYLCHLGICDWWDEHESLDLLGNLDVSPGECSCGLDATLRALASPEGVVTLPKLGQRVRITTDDGMDHVGEVIRYGDPEGNVRTLFMVALDDGSSGYFLDEPSWHWTLVPHRPEDTKGGDDVQPV